MAELNRRITAFCKQKNAEVAAEKEKVGEATQRRSSTIIARLRKQVKRLQIEKEDVQRSVRQELVDKETSARLYYDELEKRGERIRTQTRVIESLNLELKEKNQRIAELEHQVESLKKENQEVSLSVSHQIAQLNLHHELAMTNLRAEMLEEVEDEAVDRWIRSDSGRLFKDQHFSRGQRALLRRMERRGIDCSWFNHLGEESEEDISTSSESSCAGESSDDEEVPVPFATKGADVLTALEKTPFVPSDSASTPLLPIQPATVVSPGEGFQDAGRLDETSDVADKFRNSPVPACGADQTPAPDQLPSEMPRGDQTSADQASEK